MVEHNPSFTSPVFNPDKMSPIKRIQAWFAIGNLKGDKYDTEFASEGTREVFKNIGPSVIPLLIPLLERGDIALKGRVSDVLGAIGDERAVPLLLGQIEKGQETLHTFRALGEIGSPHATEPLIDYLEHGVENVDFFAFGSLTSEEECVLALGHIGDKRAVKPLTNHLWQRKCHHAATALGEIGDEESVNDLIKFCKGPKKSPEGLTAISKILEKTGNMHAFAFLLTIKPEDIPGEHVYDGSAADGDGPTIHYYDRSTRIMRDIWDALRSVSNLKEKLDQLPERERSKITELIYAYKFGSDEASFNLPAELENQRPIAEF